MRPILVIEVEAGFNPEPLYQDWIKSLNYEKK